MIVECAILHGYVFSSRKRLHDTKRLTQPETQTAEHITLASLKRDPNAPGGDRSKSTFKEDPAIPESFRSRLVDYFRSGYDRGHM